MTPHTQVNNVARAVAATHASHDPFNPDSPEVRASAIADKFITLYEDVLRQRRCRVVTGVEIECEPGDKDHGVKQADLERIAQCINERLKDAASGLGPFRKNMLYDAYNDNGHLEITTWPVAPNETVKEVDAVKKCLIETTEEYRNAAGRKLTKAGRWLKGILHTDSVLFGDHKGGLWGEHMNVSLHYTDEKTPTAQFDLGAHNMTIGPVDDLLDIALKKHFMSDMALFVSGPASFKRLYPTPDAMKGMNLLYHPRLSSGRVINVSKDKGGKLDDQKCRRREFRYPDSASNIHFTMLYTLSSVFAMTEVLSGVTGEATMPAWANMKSEDTWSNSPTYDKERASARTAQSNEAIRHLQSWRQCDDEPHTMREAVETFSKHSTTLAMMQRVVEQYVPPAQRAQYEGYIEQFKKAVIESRQEAIANETATPMQQEPKVWQQVPTASEGTTPAAR